MARRPLEIGEWGNIKRITTPNGPAARAYFRDGRGMRVPVQRRGPTPAQAETILKDALKELAKIATGDGMITPESTIHDLWAYYLAELEDEGAKDGTITTYRSAYQRHIKDEIGGVKLRQMTVARLQQVIRAQKDKPSTAKTMRVVLVNMYDVAVRHDAVRINLAKNTKPIKIERQRVVALKPDQVKGILSLFEMATLVYGKDIYDEVLLLSVTGTRTGEFLAHEWDELDLWPAQRFEGDPCDKGVVRVTGTLVVDSGTGKLKKQSEGKSLAATRGLTIPPTVTQRLRDRYRLSEGDLVFPSRAGTFQWPNNFRRRWRAVLEGTEFEGATPRDFRKAVATYLDRKVGKAGARDQLGHESDEVTTSYYIEREEEVTDFADHLEEMISKS